MSMTADELRQVLADTGLSAEAIEEEMAYAVFAEEKRIKDRETAEKQKAPEQLGGIKKLELEYAFYAEQQWLSEKKRKEQQAEDALLDVVMKLSLQESQKAQPQTTVAPVVTTATQDSTESTQPQPVVAVNNIPASAPVAMVTQYTAQKSETKLDAKAFAERVFSRLKSEVNYKSSSRERDLDILEKIIKAALQHLKKQDLQMGDLVRVLENKVVQASIPAFQQFWDKIATALKQLNEKDQKTLKSRLN